jgi:TonB family protein
MSIALVATRRRGHEGFAEVLRALSDPDIAESASQPPLSDLRVLAVGFNDLAVRAGTPQPGLPPESTASPSDVPTVDVPQAPKIYDDNDVDVVAPMILKQDIPRYPRPNASVRTGVLLIVVDETGRVESAIITQSLDRVYDWILLKAAERWTYQPATRNGVAVKYRRRIQVILPRQLY